MLLKPFNPIHTGGGGGGESPPPPPYQIFFNNFFSVRRAPKISDFSYLPIRHICGKFQLLVMRGTLFYGSLFGTTYQIMLNPYQILRNVNGYNFRLKHSFDLKFGM